MTDVCPMPFKLKKHVINALRKAIAFSIIMQHLDKHNLVDDQCTFCKKPSCETLLIKTIEDMTCSLSNSKQIDVAFPKFYKSASPLPAS